MEKDFLKKPWKKVLYEKQLYPDNYTDEKIFLKDLKKNVHFQEISFPEACLGASRLLQEFCMVVCFALFYFYMVNKWVEPWLLLYGTSSVSFLGFLFYRLKFTGQHSLGHDVRTVLTFIAFGQLFSPVLHTLTDTISTDTIYTMTFMMFLLHMIFFDYEVPAAIVSKSVSLSAAIFASICLASRLASASEAFILLTVATQFFVLSPILRKELNHHSILTLLLFIVDFYFLKQVSLLVTILFVSAVVLINAVCPLLFVKYQVYKDNIYGPWDEAVVKDAGNMVF